MPKRKPRARRRYDTDLTDVQWELIAPMIPDARAGGRPRKATSRELIDAILYFLRAGVAWRLLPHDLPPWRRPSITICDAGRRRACGSTSIMRSSSPTASGAAEKHRRRRRSSTANQSAPPIKRGRKGL